MKEGTAAHRLVLGALPCLLLLCSCGFHPVHGSRALVPTIGSERFSVHLARSSVADAMASDEVLAGVRERLARLGSLDPSGSYPRVEVEVLRSDEAAEGLRRGSGAAPIARAVEVALVARAWVVRAQGGERERETGDLRATDLVAVEARGDGFEGVSATFRKSDALRAMARRLGDRLGLATLGFTDGR